MWNVPFSNPRLPNFIKPFKNDKLCSSSWSNLDIFFFKSVKYVGKRICDLCVCVCFSKLLHLFFLLIYRRFHCSVFVLFFLICKYKGSIKQVDGNTTVEMCCVAKTISVFLVLLPTLLKPEIQAVLLSGALPCRVVECDGVQQCADQPAHARRPHARRGPQGAAQPHKGATLVPLPLICQQRSPERHLSSYCLRLRS